MNHKILLYNLREDKLIGYVSDDYLTLKKEPILNRIEDGHVRRYYVDDSFNLNIGNDIFYVITLWIKGDYKYEEFILLDNSDMTEFKKDLESKRIYAKERVYQEFKSGKSEAIKGLIREHKIKSVLD